MKADLAQIKKHFLEVLAKPTPEHRRAYIDFVCETNAELRDHLIGMLEAHEKYATPMPGDNPPRAETKQFETPSAIEPGTIVAGRYKIVEPLGQGGMGIVYFARRTSEPAMDVALKIIRKGMDSEHILNRFRNEQQALAMMNHPNIAKVLDAGMTDDGRPFFVMELVKGLSLTSFCDQGKLSVAERLELFRDICTAVQHAHQKGIVHRDLKPGNILVGLSDGKPISKIIDFGLAKALHYQLVRDPEKTSPGDFMGTWQYAAPEQVESTNLDIDTRVDIYSLGVILYELLTGAPPIDRASVEKAVKEELLRKIREEDPPKPSTKIHSSANLPSIAALRRAEPAKLEKMVRGDLDWIVMKALEKDRNRRYASANDLAAEVDRYLRDEPVAAGPPTLRYRLGKIARKHRGKIVAASMLVVLIAAAAVISTIGWITANRERRRADEQAAIAKAVNDFLRDDLLSEVDPAVQVKVGQPFVNNISVKQVLDRAAANVGKRFADRPLVEAAIRHTIGKTYMGLGDFKSAREQLERAETLRRQTSGKDDQDRLNSLYELAWLAMNTSRFSEAELMLKETAELRGKILGDQHPDTCRSKYAYALWMDRQGRHGAAQKLFEEVLAVQKRMPSVWQRHALATQRELAATLANQGDLTGAEKLLRETLESQREALGRDHPDTFDTQNSLALIYDKQKAHIKAEAALRELLAVCEATFGEKYPRYLIYSSNLAGVLNEQAKFADSLVIYQKIVPILRQNTGPKSYFTLGAVQNTALVLVALNRLSEAEPLLLEVYAGCCGTLGETHENTREVLENIIEVYTRMKKPEKAKEYQARLESANAKAASGTSK